MSSRLEKYNSSSYEELSRVKKNEDSYSSTDMNSLSRIKTNNNVSVISDAKKEIDLEKIKKYIHDNDNEEEYKRTVILEFPKEEEVSVIRKEEKEYDINSILERAKDNRESDYEENRHRKINNTQIDILKSIKIKEEEQKAIDDDTTGPIEELNTEEKTLVELINGISTHKKTNKQDLFADLMGGDDDTVVAPINEEINKESLKEELLNITQDLESIKDPGNEFTKEINIEKEKLKQEDSEYEKTEDILKADKSFYTNSITFDKSDFVEFEDLEKEVKKNSVFTKFVIALIILLLLGTIFMIVNYVFDLNII